MIERDNDLELYQAALDEISDLVHYHKALTKSESLATLIAIRDKASFATKENHDNG